MKVLFENIEENLSSENAKKVASFIRSRQQEIFDFTCELIRTPSINPPGNETAVAAVIQKRLQKLGVENVKILSSQESRPNVLAEVSGKEAGKRVMFSGHIDTKPAGDLTQWKTDPLDAVVQGDQLIGLGCGDMKAAIAAMIYAAAALNTLDSFPGTIALALTADEENGSVLGSKWLADQGLIEADVCVIGEPGGIFEEWEAIHLVSRGAALFKVVVYGTQMHSSISDQLPAVNATLKMAQLAIKMQNELRDYLTFEEHPLCKFGPTVNIGVTAQSGVTYGVYPGRAEFSSDIRTLPGMTEEQIKSDILRFLDAAMKQDPELRAELEWKLMVGATEIDSEDPIVDCLQQVAKQVLGTTPKLDAFPGATDAAYIQTAAGIPCIASFGPGYLPRAHSPNENMHVSGAAQAAMIYALSALQYLEQTKG
jgi:acetylornithine deacetylase